MTIEDMKEAVRQAEHTLWMVNDQVATMAGLCAGRLRSGGVSAYNLEKLKRELRAYNMHTRQWREER